MRSISPNERNPGPLLWKQDLSKIQFLLIFKRFQQDFKNLIFQKSVSETTCQNIFLKAFEETASSCKYYGFKIFDNISEQLQLYFKQEFGKDIKINLKEISPFDVLEDYNVPG